jgi:ABC-type sugar transport system permease subunit
MTSCLIRSVIGLLLLLPACGVIGFIYVGPALDTYETSLTDDNLVREDRVDVKGENYERLWDDPAFDHALSFTSAITLRRVMVMVFIPLIVGVVIGYQGGFMRNINRLGMTALGVFAFPLILGLLWVLFVQPFWNQDENLMGEDFIENYTLASIDGARDSIYLVDNAAMVGVAVAVGGLAFIAVLRGRTGRSVWRAGIAVWLLGILFAIASAPQTFTLPYVMTGGGPADNTTTATLYLFETAFQRFRFGYGAAIASQMIAFSLVMAFLIWVVVTGFRLRLSFEPSPSTATSGCLWNFLSLPILIVFSLPVLGLIAWGLWLANDADAWDRLGDLFDWDAALGNTWITPWVTIWFIQIPLAYLAGLSLGFVRPLGKVGSSILFLPLFAFAMLPSEALMIEWFRMARTEEWLDDPYPILMLPWLMGGISLLIFKMFFDGAADQYEAARGSGETAGRAFFHKVFLPSIPIALLVGFVLSFISGQSLLWSLVTLVSSENLTLPVQLVRLRGAFGLESGTIAGSAVVYAGILAVIFFPIFALLQVLVVDRLAILAGSRLAVTAAVPEPQVIRSQAAWTAPPVEPAQSTPPPVQPPPAEPTPPEGAENIMRKNDVDFRISPDDDVNQL